MKRSNAPIFWGLFGAGGMLSALLGAMLVFITGVAAPLGWLLPSDTLSYPHMLAFTQHWAGKGCAFVIIALFAWHAAHRLFHSLHDIHLPTGPRTKLLCYGSALAITLLDGFSLLRLGWLP